MPVEIPAVENAAGRESPGQGSDQPDRMILLDGGEAEDLQHFAIGGGSAVAYSRRAPDKDTDNEDTLRQYRTDPTPVYSSLPTERAACRWAGKPRARRLQPWRHRCRPR